MSTSQLLQQELETYESNKAELIASAQGKYALIHDGQVVGTYADERDAITQGYRQFGNVPFLVRLIAEYEAPANFVNNNIGL